MTAARWFASRSGCDRQAEMSPSARDHANPVVTVRARLYKEVLF
jgi:hypothetical protein